MTAAIAILAIACIAGLSFEFLTAPVGYEDADGFHFGEPE